MNFLEILWGILTLTGFVGCVFCIPYIFINDVPLIGRDYSPGGDGKFHYFKKRKALLIRNSVWLITGLKGPQKVLGLGSGVLVEGPEETQTLISLRQFLQLARPLNPDEGL